ncbi:MAG: hypothetical protein GY697_16060 [Desulfobacterales bacterium]|nr:hypothetical protein [Desulfobacterales bacterium]
MNQSYKPNASRPLLFLTAGLLWTLVGLWLCTLAIIWLQASEIEKGYLYILMGSALGLGAYLSLFLPIVRRNIERLKGLPEQSCFFAFQAWHSYLVIVFMVALGMILRHSTIPKHWLAVVYMTIGSALLGASLHYYSRLKKTNGNEPE